MSDDFLREFDRMNKQMNTLITGQTRIEVVVEGHGKKIDKLEGKIDGMKEDLNKMPHQWREDIDTGIRSHKKQQEEVSQAMDLGAERAKKATKSSSTYHTPPTMKRERRAGWFSNAIRDAIKPFITLVIISGMAVGVGIATSKCSEGPPIDRASFEEARHDLDKLREEVKKAGESTGEVDAEIP